MLTGSKTTFKVRQMPELKVRKPFLSFIYLFLHKNYSQTRLLWLYSNLKNNKNRDIKSFIYWGLSFFFSSSVSWDLKMSCFLWEVWWTAMLYRGIFSKNLIILLTFHNFQTLNNQNVSLRLKLRRFLVQLKNITPVFCLFLRLDQYIACHRDEFPRYKS